MQVLVPHCGATLFCAGTSAKRAAAAVEKILSAGISGFSWRQRGTEPFEADVSGGAHVQHSCMPAQAHSTMVPSTHTRMHTCAGTQLIVASLFQRHDGNQAAVALAIISIVLLPP